MNQHLITLKTWSPAWDDVYDDVDLENRASLTESLRAFIKNPLGNRVFSSIIPFRMKGLVYDHPTFDDGEGIMTSFVREVRRIDPIGKSAAFEVETYNHVYVIEIENVSAWL